MEKCGGEWPISLIPALNIPVAGDPRIPTPLTDNDTAIRTVVNGNLDATNITAGSLTDACLASPASGAYRTVASAQGLAARTTLVAGTYFLGPQAGLSTSTRTISLLSSTFALAVDNSTDAIASSASLAYISPFYIAAADHAISGKTTKARVRGVILPNGTTATGVTFTFGLYPLSSSGAANTLAFTAGTVTASSTAAIVAPSGSTTSQAVSSDFSLPSDGAFALAVVTNATLTSNFAALLQASLQIHNI